MSKLKLALFFEDILEKLGMSFYKIDNKTFCFSIDLRNKYKSKQTIYSIYINKDKGPCFSNALFWVNNNWLKKVNLWMMVLI